MEISEFSGPMIRRFAAHYIYTSGNFYYRHVAEVDTENSSIFRMFLLERECETVEFFNGIIVVSESGSDLNKIRMLLKDAANLHESIYSFLSVFEVPTRNVPMNYVLYLFENIDFARMTFLQDAYVTQVFPK